MTKGTTLKKNKSLERKHRPKSYEKSADAGWKKEAIADKEEERKGFIMIEEIAAISEKRCWGKWETRKTDRKYHEVRFRFLVMRVQLHKTDDWLVHSNFATICTKPACEIWKK